MADRLTDDDEKALRWMADGGLRLGATDWSPSRKPAIHIRRATVERLVALGFARRTTHAQTLEPMALTTRAGAIHARTLHHLDRLRHQLAADTRGTAR